MPRLGPGPVFVYEGLTAARRWQPYAMRAVFVCLILVGMAMVQGDIRRTGPDQRVSLRDLALFGENLYKVVSWVELTLVLLAAPAATAGAVCLDRARGTLDHLLVTDLSNAEIVLGKLGIRLIPVLGLIACTVPVLFLASLLGGIDPTALVGLFLLAIGCAVLGCSLAMALSVYGRKTHEVVMLAYVLIILWITSPALIEIVEHVVVGIPPPVPSPPGVAPVTLPGVSPLWGLAQDWLSWSNPYFLAFAPYRTPPPVDSTAYLRFLAACLALSAVMVILAMARVRRVALGPAGRSSAGWRRRLARVASRAWLPGPSLDRNPVAWREWHRSRPSRMMRVAWGIYGAMGLLWIALAALGSWRGSMQVATTVGIMNMIQVTIGLLLVSVGASASLSEERARGSLDVLLSTAMTTRSVLAGKWWGGFRRSLGVAIWPAATTAILAYDRGYWSGWALLVGLVLAYAAVLNSLGLAIATWVSRLGRAIALCVTVYVLFLIGWPIVLSIALRGDRAVRQGFLIADPPVGVLVATLKSAGPGADRMARELNRDDYFVGTFAWIAVLCGVSAALFSATLASFDDCMGRIPDSGMRPPARPRARSALSADELLALVPSHSEGEEES